MAHNKITSQMITDAYTVGWNHGYDGMKGLPAYLKGMPAKLTNAYHNGYTAGQVDRAAKVGA